MSGKNVNPVIKLILAQITINTMLFATYLIILQKTKDDLRIAIVGGTGL